MPWSGSQREIQQLIAAAPVKADAVLHHPALLPIGDRYTMGPEDAVRAAEMIQPRLVIPMHYDTFPTIEQDPQAFRRLAEEKTGIPVAVLKPGEAIML